MEITALAKYIRVSPRKLQLLAKSVSLMVPETAVGKLKFINKSGSLELQKVITSAMSNAKRLNLADIKNLKISQIQVLPAGGMKRFRAVSRGMAHEYKKRMSHIKVILSDKVENKINTIQKMPTEKLAKKK
jgi:large subunit ribosomal protein L22